uniref:FBA_2 domain-containing protein n=1 Tax=Steinernema glaseri TaxID=37863 RepID=A0A1I7Y7S0_9BILA
MDGVPLVFIESVIRSSDLYTSKELQQLSTTWGDVGEVRTKKKGHLKLTFAPYNGDDEDWLLHYKIEGFDHIKSRTLSREVVREMSKSIEYIKFGLDYSYFLDEEWNSISPDNVALLQLLTNLDAPKKNLDLASVTIIESGYIELSSKYSNFFRSFTSVKLNCFKNTRLMEDTISEPRVRTVQITPYKNGYRPVSFWVDFFFSEKCMRLEINDIDVALGVIEHWKKMDPRNLKYSKVFYAVFCSSESLKDIKMQEINLETKAALLKKVKNKVGRENRVKSLHYIDHPVDLSKKIYVVVYATWLTDNLALLFD